MKQTINQQRFQQAQSYESAYWVARQTDPVGFLRDLDSNYALGQHLQREGYLSPPPRRLLDIGCGGLGVGILWLLQAQESYGLDPLPVLPPKTNCKVLDEFILSVQAQTKYIRSQAETMQFDDNFFDFIVCNNVLDHVHKPFQILAEIKRILSPTGIFAFAVDTHSFRTLVWKKILKNIMLNYGSLPGHPYEWTESQMQAALIQAGFRIESHKPRSIKGRLLGQVRRTTWLLRHA